VFYGAANRDERKFHNPHTFDVMRGAADQMAFGSGPHMCVGLHLARLEMNAIFCALATRVLDDPAQSLRAREAEWELGTFATDKYRSSLTTSRNHYAA